MFRKLLKISSVAGLMLLFGANAWAGEWTYTGSLNYARIYHTATSLPAPWSKVLVVGGYPSNGCELYDQATKTWSVTGVMSTSIRYHTATLLKSNKVLVTGGFDASMDITSSCELYDPATEWWTIIDSMNIGREHHTATQLDGRKGIGKILVTGGGGNSGEALNSCEVWDGTSWSSAHVMSRARESHTATLLPNGNVFVAGGKNSSGWLSSGEIYDPTQGWATKSIEIHKGYHTATLLQNGKVLIALWSGACQLFDYRTDAVTSTGSMNDKYRAESYTATLLQDGKVLVAGGGDTSGVCSSCELYDPVTETWTLIESMNTAVKANHTATVLPSGKVLVAGGLGQQGAINSCELYETSSPMRAGVAGRVTEEQKGVPIAGAEIAILSDPTNIRSLIANAYSDSNGNYEAEFELQADTEVVYVACGKSGYKGEWWDNKFSPQNADFVVVTNGQIHDGIDFALGEGFTTGFIGKVVEEGSGVGINDAKVSVYYPQDTLTVIAECFSRNDGGYYIPLSPGSYLVRADKPGYEGEWYYEGNPQIMNVYAMQPPEDVSFTLASLQEGAISGFVTGERDSAMVMPPYAYLGLYASPYDSSPIAYQSNGSQSGFYRFSQLKPGTYYVHIEHAYGPNCQSYIPEWWDNELLPQDAEPIVVTNSEVKSIDFYLVCAGATEVGEVAGAVRDNVTWNPIKGAYVKIVGFNSLGAYTDYDGKYLIKKVPVGMQSAVASAAGYMSIHWDTFEVKANELTEEINFLLNPDSTSVTYGSISGHVQDSSCMSFLSDAFVAVFSVNANNSVATVKTNRQGRYKVEKLLPGKYHVRARSQGFQEQWYQLQETRDWAYEVTVKAGQDTPGIHFYLNDEQGLNGSIAGMVLDTLEQGIPGARVWAQGGWDRYEVNADNTGAYLIEDAMFGLYRVGAYADGYKPGTHSEPVPVIPDSVTPDIDIVLESMPAQDGVISGVVTDDSTQAIEKAMVVVLRQNPRFFGYAFTDANGAYAVKNVPIDRCGAYYVIAFALEHLPEFYDGVHSWRAATKVTPPATSIDFQLGHSRKGIMAISGRLTEAGKAGVSEAMIYAMDGEEIVGAAYSLENGTYLLSQLPPGTYNLNVSKPGYDDVTYGPVSVVDQNVSGADIEVPATGVSEENTALEKQALWLSVTPSIARNNVTIYYTLPEKTNTELSVYDVSGRKAATLVKGRTDAGTHRAILNTSELTQGIYFVRLKGGKAHTIKKLIILQ